MDSLELLNKFIGEGVPPERMSLEHNSKSERHIIFTWNDGTILKIDYGSTATCTTTLIRFLDFWR